MLASFISRWLRGSGAVHPTEADASHPTEADASHPTEADASHHTEAGASHPTEADASHPTGIQSTSPPLFQSEALWARGEAPLFAAMVALSAGVARLTRRGGGTGQRAARFFRIALALPLELQQLLALRYSGLGGSQIPHDARTEALGDMALILGGLDAGSSPAAGGGGGLSFADYLMSHYSEMTSAEFGAAYTITRHLGSGRTGKAYSATASGGKVVVIKRMNEPRDQLRDQLKEFLVGNWVQTRVTTTTGGDVVPGVSEVTRFVVVTDLPDGSPARYNLIFDDFDGFPLGDALPLYSVRMRKALTVGNPPTLGEALSLCLQLVQTSLHCRDAGVFHRDLSPYNILIRYPSADPSSSTSAATALRVIDWGEAWVPEAMHKELAGAVRALATRVYQHGRQDRLFGRGGVDDLEVSLRFVSYAPDLVASRRNDDVATALEVKMMLEEWNFGGTLAQLGLEGFRTADVDAPGFIEALGERLQGLQGLRPSPPL
jgi:hypothetical protein